jgi:hypothetical protein
MRGSVCPESDCGGGGWRAVGDPWFGRAGGIVGPPARAANPGLAAQFDAAAYQADPTPVADTDLLNDESSPLDTYLPAGTGTSASQPVSALAVSPAGNVVAVVSDSTVRLYDAADPARPPAAVGGQVSANVPAWPLAFSSDGRVLASAGAGDGRRRKHHHGRTG